MVIRGTRLRVFGFTSGFCRDFSSCNFGSIVEEEEERYSK